MDDFLVAFINAQPAVERPKGLTDELIKEIAEEHIKRFGRMLATYHPNIRRGECKRYLSIHMQIRADKYDWDKMDKLGKYEVSEAYLMEYADYEEAN